MSSLFYDTHIFCCLNERDAGHKRGCCGNNMTRKLQKYMKSRLKELSLEDKVQGRFRVNKSGCLDRCELGPVLVIYPDGTWYHYKDKEDIDEIIDTHIVGGEIVKRLVVTPDQDKELEPRQLKKTS